MKNREVLRQKKGVFELFCQDVRGISNRFGAFCDMYSSYFNVPGHDVSHQARCYVSGLCMEEPRKNMERMEEYIPDCDYQATQQFLTDSPWDDQALLFRIAQDVSREIGGPDAQLCIDETAITKKGNMSVGVARQHNGRLGKTDNCQVGVFATLVNGKYGCIIGKRLYLPKVWTTDKARCEKAGIPEECRVFKTKPQLALELVDETIRAGVRFRFVCADAFYGNNPQLLRGLADRGIEFIADVHMNQGLYTEDPEPYLPRRRTSIGPKYKILKSRGMVQTVKSFIATIEKHQWRDVSVRDSTKGMLFHKAFRKQVWLWDGDERKAKRWWLVVIKHDDGVIKAFISNAKISTTLTDLVKAHAQRFWIERSFQDAKTSLGMADYQARKWNSWQHHMALVSLAMFFGLLERLHYNTSDDILSYQDIVELLNLYLPRKDRTEEQVLKNLQQRHEKRIESTKSAYRKQLELSRINQ
jgi:SRSO17 transposase